MDIKVDIKERIQQKAKDLFHRYGIKSITMDEIANQLGASKKTIYQYFSDKDELVDAIAAEMIDHAQSNCNNRIIHTRDALHEIFLAMEFVQQLFSEMNPAMMYDLERFHSSSYKRFLDYKNKFLYQVIRTNLKRGIEEELYRPDINLDIMTKVRLEGMTMGFNQEVFPASKYNLGELQAIIIEHFLFGVASLKGFKLILKYQQERLKS